MITMRGTIEECHLFTFRVEPARVAALLPAPLELVDFGGFAYFNVVVCRLSHMRPAFVPLAIGIGYHHVAYRLYVRYGQEEGLYFLRSDADSRLIATFGNALTDFRFHLAKVTMADALVTSDVEGARLRIAIHDDAPDLSPNGPFATIGEAGDRLKYKPAAFSVRPDGVDILRITRDEQRWRYRLRAFDVETCEFLSGYGAVPEIAYDLEPIDYQWNRAERLR